MSHDLADLLLHPVRLRVVQALIHRDLTTQQLASELPDVASATLYRHVRRLADAGLLEVVATRRVRGRTERTYRLVTTAANLGPDEVADLTPAQHVRYLQVFVASLLEQGVRYLTSDGADPTTDGFGYRQGALWLADEELAALAEDLAAVVGRYAGNGPGDGRRRRNLITVLLPDPR